MREEIAAGLIGCGGRGQLYCDLSRRVEGLRIVAYADMNEDRARSCLDKYGGAYATREVERVLADRSLDAVLICTWHDTHTPYAVAAAQNKKHIFIEKPLAMTVQECTQIKEAVEKAGVKLMVAFKMRFMPVVRAVRELVPEPLFLVGQMVDNRWGDENWAQKPVTGGGNVISQGCHTADLLCFLAGSRPRSVAAQAAPLTHPGSEVIDTTSASILFESGAIASLVQSDCGLNPFVSKFFFEVWGEGKGACLFRRCHEAILWGTEPGRLSAEEMSDEAREDAEGDLGLLRAFADSLVQACQSAVPTCREGATPGGQDSKPVPGPDEGLTATAIIEAAFQSARTGKAVYL